MPSTWKDTVGKTKGKVQKRFCNPRWENVDITLKPKETCSELQAKEQQSI